MRKCSPCGRSVQTVTFERTGDESHRAQRSPLMVERANEAQQQPGRACPGCGKRRSSRARRHIHAHQPTAGAVRHIVGDEFPSRTQPDQRHTRHGILRSSVMAALLRSPADVSPGPERRTSLAPSFHREGPRQSSRSSLLSPHRTVAVEYSTFCSGYDRRPGSRRQAAGRRNRRQAGRAGIQSAIPRSMEECV